MYLSAFSQADLPSMLDMPYYHLPRVHPSTMQFARALKGGLLSIATQELLLALQPSPPGLDHGIAAWHTSGG